ncbi:probable serine hydrolase [Contarinia nasturtii]|uniref:probable serine hydrolase n=1 Tax=Contarinia nasturtii TaxID=265458 RepID=UPI0012D385AC|nr:probable serine hydrolase [Contarinia nasturtii]
MPNTNVLSSNNVDESNSTTNGDIQQNELEIPHRHWEEVTFEVPWGTVAGKWYGDRDKQPVIALHGWQDNSGTFDRLIPLLPKTIAVWSIDLPGHGYSSHFPTGINYHVFWDYIPLVRRIVKHFGWKKVKLMGHSLGGAVCFMYAASFPDEVSQFISIDLYGPSVRDLKKNAAMTGHCIDKALEYERLPASKLPCYSYDEMITVANDAYKGWIDRDAAKILMIRGMKEAPKSHSKDGYFFSRDLRLKVSLLGMFSLEHVLAYAELIKCHVLNIRAVPGIELEKPEIYPMVLDAMRKNATLEYHEVPGTHHLHLMTPHRISGIISGFLLNPDSNNDD